MPKEWVYVIYTAALVIAKIAVVPRPHIRRLAFPAILLGGMADILVITILHLTGAAAYANYGVFGVFGIPFFPTTVAATIIASAGALARHHTINTMIMITTTVIKGVLFLARDHIMFYLICSVVDVNQYGSLTLYKPH